MAITTEDVRTSDYQQMFGIDASIEEVKLQLEEYTPQPNLFTKKARNRIKDGEKSPLFGVKLLRLKSFAERLQQMPNVDENVFDFVSFFEKEKDKDYFIYCSFDISGKDEIFAIETIRLLYSQLVGQNLAVLNVASSEKLKEATDAWFESIGKWLLTDSNPKSPSGSTLSDFKSYILEAIKKYVLKGKKTQVKNPRSPTNKREILLFELKVCALQLIYRSAKYRSKLLMKFTPKERGMKVKNLHNPLRIRSALTKEEALYVDDDLYLSQAWAIQSRNVRKIISSVSNGTCENARKLIAESNEQFCKSVPKAVLRIAYGRMKVRNQLIASVRKKGRHDVPTPKLSTVLTRMVKAKDKYGYPGLVIPAFKTTNFVSVYDQYVDVTLDKNNIVLGWKQESIQDFAKLREYIRTLECDQDSPEDEVPSTDVPEIHTEGVVQSAE